MTYSECLAASLNHCAEQGSTVVPVERRLATSSAVAALFTAHRAAEQKQRRSTSNDYLRSPPRRGVKAAPWRASKKSFEMKPYEFDDEASPNAATNCKM